MNGPNEIRNINRQRVIDKATELKTKANAARAQNHPRADVFEAEYENFKNANSDVVKESN